jgi:hypothetical protein
MIQEPGKVCWPFPFAKSAEKILAIGGIIPSRYCNPRMVIAGAGLQARKAASPTLLNAAETAAEGVSPTRLAGLRCRELRA